MPHDDRGLGRDGELPEGVIDADPAGGWEDGDVADQQTRERSDAEAAEAEAPTGYVVEAEDVVESAEATAGIDPDLAIDDDGTRP